MKYFGVIVALALGVSLSHGQEFESPYYPLKIGTKWHYRSGDEKVMVHVRKAEQFDVLKVDAKDKESKEKIKGVTLEISSGGRTLAEQIAVLPAGVYRFGGGPKTPMPGGVYRFASAGKEITPPLCFLKLPTMQGESWSFECTSRDSVMKGTFVSEAADVTVPAGRFQTITTATKEPIGDSKMTMKYWFALNVGMVKQEVHAGSFNLVLELEKFEPAR